MAMRPIAGKVAFGTCVGDVMTWRHERAMVGEPPTFLTTRLRPTAADRPLAYARSEGHKQLRSTAVGRPPDTILLHCELARLSGNPTTKRLRDHKLAGPARHDNERPSPIHQPVAHKPAARPLACTYASSSSCQAA
jgi:hypothetical protein